MLKAHCGIASDLVAMENTGSGSLLVKAKARESHYFDSIFLRRCQTFRNYIHLLRCVHSSEDKKCFARNSLRVRNRNCGRVRVCSA
jgi:hypothetical protein